MQAVQLLAGSRIVDAQLPGILHAIIRTLRVGQRVPGQPKDPWLVAGTRQSGGKLILGLRKTVENVVARDDEPAVRWNRRDARVDPVASRNLCGRPARMSEER